MAAGPTLFLIDGSNQMYRAYHAIRGLTRSDGKSTNATYGLQDALSSLREATDGSGVAAGTADP